MSKLDEGEPVDMICLDFQKAFGRVRHRNLLNDIGAHGVRGKNILCPLRDLFDPGTWEAAHHPGISFVFTVHLTVPLTIQFPIAIVLINTSTLPA
eukprot:g21661.t1